MTSETSDCDMISLFRVVSFVQLCAVIAWIAIVKVGI